MPSNDSSGNSREARGGVDPRCGGMGEKGSGGRNESKAGWDGISGGVLFDILFVLCPLVCGC